MDYLVFFIFLIVALSGFISLIFGFPGNFIILADSIIYGWYGDFKQISIRVIIVMFVLTIMGEVLEFLIGVVGSKKYKSSNYAVAGSIIGGIAGGIWGVFFLLGAGSIPGAFLGAFAGAFIVELIRKKEFQQALDSGWGAFIGKLGGTFTKGLVGFTMILICIYSVIKN